ncbi:hypothetical protein HMPREF9120_02916 [Neisseria sp. oral taxon 020 str. F0370]|nr:hypothetical protein CGZ77_02265 [Neisseria sp. KEM232]EKY02480.1 hypothetical protein HMPREF9120_02916 [Neisseria sp. oral taxon 020 str. F0370]
MFMGMTAARFGRRKAVLTRKGRLKAGLRFDFVEASLSDGLKHSADAAASVCGTNGGFGIQKAV